MKYKIEKNIPLPEKKQSLRALVKTMKRGDSIRVKTKNEAASIGVYLYTYKYKAVRKKLSNGTYRVWRA